MSLFGSLTTAVSGLTAQQDAIGNVSNNIANSQTVGYKGIGTAFQELVTDSNEDYNAPGGVTARPVYQNALSGPLTQSQTSTNLAISGSGFFAVAAPPSTSSSGSLVFSDDTYYTRAGDFQVNKNGYLTNSAGYYLQGYPVDSTTGVTSSSSLEPIQVPQGVLAPQATSDVYTTANLPSNYTTAGSSTYTSPTPTTQTVYDAQGNAYTMTTQFDYIGSDKTNNGSSGLDEWQATYSISPSTGAGSSSAPFVADLYFNTSATSPSATAGTLNSIKGVSSGSSYYSSSSAAFVTSGNTTLSASATSGTAAITLPFVVGNASSSLSLTVNYGTLGSFTNTTSSTTSGNLSEYDGTSVNVTSQNQNGYASGSYTGTSIDSNGYVSVSYSNGQSLKYYQIPLAQFDAPQDLNRETGSVFTASTDSGTAQLDVPGANGAGTISPSEVEGSNVDIATQFTQLIVAQQAYSANSKVITTADQLLTTLIQAVQ